MPWASAPGSFGSTSKPVTPSSTASAAPPTRVATTGTPAAMDSSSTLDSPSLSEGNTETETCDRISGTSSRRPVKTTRPSRPRRATDAASACAVSLVGGRGLPDDQEARGRVLGLQDRGRLEEILEALARAQPRHDRDERTALGEPELVAQPGAVGRLPEARELDAVRDHRDLGLVVSVGDEPLLHGLGIHHDPVGEPAHHALDAELQRRTVHAHVPDRRDDDRRPGQARGGDREHVRIEAVGVHDLDPVAPEIRGELEPLAEGPAVVEVA